MRLRPRTNGSAMRTPDNDIAPPPDRYTSDGDAAVEARVARDQALIAAAVTRVLPPPRFRALVLMGGYGRAEGGFVMHEGQPAPFNDYDYFIVVRGMGRAERAALEQTLARVSQELKGKVGVDVDFALLRDESLAKADYSLINAEMLWGHRVVAGDPRVLAAMPAMPFAGLPQAELTRLMLNRGSLLLMNQRRLEAGEALTGQRLEIFFKFLFKAVRACGDARLAGNRRYHPAYLTKAERLAGADVAWPGQAEFLGLYDQAMEAKFHPRLARYEAEGADPRAWQGRMVKLWLDTLAWFEGVRLGRPIPDWEDYASPTLGKGQGRDTLALPGNLARNLKTFGPLGLLRHARWALRHPRDRLISALPVLLANPGAAASPAVADALGIAAGSPWMAATERFLDLWRRYS